MCLICDRIGMIKRNENPYFVMELQTGYVVIGDHQHFEGYTLFLCKHHETELFHLEYDVKMKFLEEMSIVAESAASAFHAEKMNYELLGNGDTHLHWHLFPRRAGDLGEYGNAGKGPVWCYPMEKMYGDDNRPEENKLCEMKEKLSEELNKRIMAVNGKTFSIIKLLGKGKGGYSYLATDGERKYVLKQIHHEPCDYYQFGNKIEAEMNDYKRLKDIGIRIPNMIDVDIENERVLKDYIEGETIYDMVLHDRMESRYMEQVTEMCKLLYPAHTNIDYFPTNFVVQDGEIYYIDFECNDYMEEWNFENWGIKYWSKTSEFQQYVKEHSE